MYLLTGKRFSFLLGCLYYKNTKPTRDQYQGGEIEYEEGNMDIDISFITHPLLIIESRSSAGQSATLIMQRSAVRACPRLLIEWIERLKKKRIKTLVQSNDLVIKLFNHLIFTRGGISSAGQSACLARRRSRVRLPYSPQFCEFDLKVDGQSQNKYPFIRRAESIKIIDINGKNITKRKPSAIKRLSLQKQSGSNTGQKY